MYFQSIVCLECGATMAPDLMMVSCTACQSQWLDARYDYDAVSRLWPDELETREKTLWRYGELLPLQVPDPEISLQEGFTPLLRLYPYEREYAHKNLYVKDERQGPTSSFKDRQAAMAVTAMKLAGITECVLASTGNAASAYAAYCARAGIKLWLFLTSMVPSEKMREAALYGAEVVKVSGTYDEAKHVAAQFAKHKGIHLDRGAKAIPGKESMKTLGFEIAEQLGLAMNSDGRWRAPDWYIQAVSGGIGPMGVWKAFSELHTMGLIDRMPKLGIIQAAGCAPMVESFNRGDEIATPVTPHTLITVLATGDPGYSYVHLRQAVLQTGGTMLAVDDGDTFAAMRKVASRAGLSVEPATAVAFAGLEKMLADGTLGEDEVVVVNGSGHTFPAESHVLGDQYIVDFQLAKRGVDNVRSTHEGLSAALQGLDEQVTTILVVDDNAAQRRLIRRLLRSYKRYRIFEARSGIEALKVIEEHIPDLIVTDLNMPEMDGLTLLEQLKWNPATQAIPVVVVSARTLSTEDRVILDRYSDSVWEKGGMDVRALVDHIVTTLGDQPIEVLPPRDREFMESSQTSSIRNTNHYTIVIVDDNEADARLARKLIEREGRYRVIETHSGREGLKAMYEFKPDLVILDLLLPDIDGLTIIKTIEEDLNLNGIPIIVYSGKELSTADRQRLRHQIRRYIDKASFDKEAFLSTIADVLS